MKVLWQALLCGEPRGFALLAYDNCDFLLTQNMSVLPHVLATLNQVTVSSLYSFKSYSFLLNLLGLTLM
jgi:hypothetical protein